MCLVVVIVVTVVVVVVVVVFTYLLLQGCMQGAGEITWTPFCHPCTFKIPENIKFLEEKVAIASLSPVYILHATPGRISVSTSNTHAY